MTVMLVHEPWLSRKLPEVALLLGLDLCEVAFLTDVAVMVVRPELVFGVLDYYGRLAPQIHEVAPYRDDPDFLTRLDAEICDELRECRTVSAEVMTAYFRQRHVAYAEDSRVINSRARKAIRAKAVCSIPGG